MKRFLRQRTAPFAALALVLAVLSASGCAKKVAIDQLGHLLVPTPEGTRDTLDRTPSDLVVWPDAAYRVTDTDASGGSYLAYRTGAGAMQGMILDYIQSQGYVVFRGEGMQDSAGVAARGGYRRFSDFPLSPYRRWSDRDYYTGPQGPVVLAPAQAFAFSDAAPPADSLKVYVGRSVISGVSSRNHPLTNRGQTLTIPGKPDTIPVLVYTGSTAPSDSLIPLSWQPVMGAAGYWVHIYNTFEKRKERNLSADEAIAIGLPSPVARGGDRMMVRDLFIGYFPASVTAYKLGDAAPVGSRVLVYRVLPALQKVRVRVSAVDARGRMIATIGLAGDLDSYKETVGGRLRTFPTGAKGVTPGR